MVFKFLKSVDQLPSPSGGVTDEAASAAFKALGHPSRTRIARLLFTEGEMSFKDLAAQMSQSPASTFQHLEQMLRADLVVRHGQGKAVRYRFNPEALAPGMEFIMVFSGPHAEPL